MKAIKLRIYPTLEQRRQLSREFAVRRHVWNWALERRSSAYKTDKTSLNAVGLSRELTRKKASDTSLCRVSSTALNNTLWDLDAAFQNFFKKQGRYPKRKKFGAVNSVCYTLDKRKKVFRDGELLKLPKVGSLRVVWSREVPVFPNTATVSKTPDGRWFVSLQIDYTDPVAAPTTDKQIGIDLGLTCFAALSDGEKIYSPKPLKQGLRRLAHAQRATSRAQRGSSNRRKARQRVARIHRQIADQRANFLHQQSTRIVGENAVIAIEDLHVRGMMANGKLARSIGDASWGEFRRMLTYKSKWMGRDLRIVQRFERTTGVCPDCGLVGDRLPLNVRSWTCECGATHDRDVAAARMILSTARSAGIYDPGLANKPDDSGASRDNTGWDEGVKAQHISPHGRGQRVSRSQGARLCA
ncbi:MAG: hypothetical protein DDT20_01896 [Firmicutes bacterium]|nr:hypothetical protein [Bacillota bacterium]